MSTATLNGHAAPDWVNTDVLKVRAIGHVHDILTRVAGIPAELLDPSREHPCPKCGGDTRFRLVNEDAGSIFCNKCCKNKDQGSGDFIGAVQWGRGVDFVEAKRLIATHLGLTAPSAVAPRLTAAEVLQRVCAAKKMPIDAAIAHGAKVVGQCVRFPMFGPDGQECSGLTIGLDAAYAKGKCDTGKSTGIYLPCRDGKPRLPQPRETWLAFESVKDAAAAAAMGFLAVGMQGARLKEEFARLFLGVVFVIVPDLDDVSFAGAETTKKRLARIARRIVVARLPGEMGTARDWRDVIADGPDGQDAAREAVAVALAEQQATVEPIQLIPSSEFLSGNYHREWIVNDVVTAGEPAMMAALQKCLKTSIAIDLALSVGLGVEFLGKFKTTRQIVAVLSGESGELTLQDTAIRIAKSKGVHAHSADVLWGFKLPCLGSPAGLESLEAMLDEHQVKLLIIDPVYLSLMGAETKGLSTGNIFDMGPLLAGIVDACKRQSATPLLIHHCRKNSPLERFSPPELSEMSGAGFAEFCRQWLLLARRGEYESDGHHELWLQIGGSAGHGGLYALDVDEGTIEDPGGRHWDITLTKAQDARESEKRRKAERRDAERAERLQADRKAVCDVLAKASGEIATKTVIKAATGISTARLDAAIATLLQERSIEPAEIVKGNNRRYDGFKLGECSSDS